MCFSSPCSVGHRVAFSLWPDSPGLSCTSTGTVTGWHLYHAAADVGIAWSHTWWKMHLPQAGFLRPWTKPRWNKSEMCVLSKCPLQRVPLPSAWVSSADWSCSGAAAAMAGNITENKDRHLNTVSQARATLDLISLVHGKHLPWLRPEEKVRADNDYWGESNTFLNKASIFMRKRMSGQDHNLGEGDLVSFP